MRYMLMICSEESVLPGPAETETDPQYRSWSEEMDRRGVLQGGARLRPSSDATTVRVREEEVLLSDGPFAETTEVIVGFDILECADLDDAIEAARTHPMAYSGRIEVRPFGHLSRD
jgi:hypothetical protein